MKKTVLTLCAISSIIGCLFCGCFGKQEYVCDAEAVKSIQIIKLDTYMENEYRYEYTVLCEMEDTKIFAESLNNLEQTVNMGEPGWLKTGYTVIRVDYLNGDYDLLYANAQWFHRDGVSQNGYVFFDKNQFDTLISDYLKTKDTTENRNDSTF